jgi:hypothetical protein
MRCATLDRREFVEWIGGRSVPRIRAGAPADLREGQVALVWLSEEDDPTTPIVVVPTRELRDFFAFATTYIGSFSPLSAFFEVVPFDLLNSIPRSPRALHEDTLKPFIGLCIAEAYAQLGGEGRRPNDISIQASLATQSSTGLVALACNYSNELVLEALQRWQGVRHLTGADSSRLPGMKVAEVWELALGGTLNGRVGVASQDRILLSQLVRSAFSDGLLSSPSVWRLAAGPINSQSEALTFSGTREERVTAFDEVVRAMRTADVSDTRKEAVIGFLAAQVAEGSFSYLSLLDEVARELPLSVVWFGFFAGLHPKSDVLVAGDCLGRRLERRVRASARTLGLSLADISFEELRIVSDEVRLRKLRTEQQSVLRVELIPGVIGLFRQQRETRSDGGAAKISLAAVKELKAALGRVASLVDELDAREPSLFPDAASASRPKAWATVKPRKPRSTKK